MNSLRETIVQNVFFLRRASKKKFNIRLRAELVQELACGLEIHSVLDLGCGDGSIGLSFLRPERSIVLLDFSNNTLARIPEKIPSNF